jgi:hypothetical protein
MFKNSILGFVFFTLISPFASAADDARFTHTLSANPAQAQIRFEGREIKSFKAEDLKRRAASCSKLIQNNSEIYDNLVEGIKILKSSDSPNLIHSGINNGLAGAMFEAYANHIPLTLRPDDVWLAITAAFGLYVNHHPELMRKLLVTHEGKQELIVRMGGSLAMSNERFWEQFTSLMLEEMKKYTNGDLAKWLVPEFSTTTDRDRLVGQIVVMGAMKEYFNYTGVLSSALTELTLKGTLEDWKSVRDRAAMLAAYGDVMAKWVDVLLPVLDEFVAAYEGRVNEAFWQKMITYKRLGSGGEKKLRGWFVVFAPFNGNGDYYLNSKEEIAKTGIYAEIRDANIQTATVAVPVKLDDNGTMHSLVFWGGVSLPAYDAPANRVSPSVDWAIIDKTNLSKEELLKAISGRFWEWKWVPEKYRALLTEEEFGAARKEREHEQKLEQEKREAEWAAKRAAIIAGPREELLKHVGRQFYWSKYEDIHEDFRKVVSEKEFEEAKAVRKVELDREQAERKAKMEAEEKAFIAELQTLPKDVMLSKLALRYSWGKYDKLPEELQKLVTEAEYVAAVNELKEKQRRERDEWQ